MKQLRGFLSSTIHNALTGSWARIFAHAMNDGWCGAIDNLGFFDINEAKPRGHRVFSMTRQWEIEDWMWRWERKAGKRRGLRGG